MFGLDYVVIILPSSLERTLYRTNCVAGMTTGWRRGRILSAAMKLQIVPCGGEMDKIRR